jgi:hypothetical protein
MRRYDFDVERLDKQIIHACRTDKDFLNRLEVYQQCLTQKLPFRHKTIYEVIPNKKYNFKARDEEDAPVEVAISFDDDIIALKEISIPQFCEEPRVRQPIIITWQQLEEVAQFIDKQTGGSQWIDLLQQIDYRDVNALQSAIKPKSITIDGFAHLAGMVASGKSILSYLIAAHLVYKHIHNPSSSQKRITLIVGDSACSTTTKITQG